MSNLEPKSFDDYTVAVFAAMEFEISAFRYMLDREHPRLPQQRGDPNVYTFGELNGLNIVMVCLAGGQGNTASAALFANVTYTFPSIKYRICIGIGGGVPSDAHDIRLGDVIVSMPDAEYGGVVQYDLGRDDDVGFQRKGTLFPVDPVLRGVVQTMASDHRTRQNNADEYITAMTRKHRDLSRYGDPSANNSDILYREDHPHIRGEKTCAKCGRAPQHVVQRPTKRSGFPGPHIHYGLIASGNRVIKSATKRREFVENVGDVLCFEMEAAGMAFQAPFLVIRGVSDYADSHKNDAWHYYAAATAAATAKEILSYLSAENSPAVTAQRPGTVSNFSGTGFQNSGSGSISVGGDMNFGRS